jgi:hypothetical protein
MTASQPPRRLTRPYLAASALTLLLAVVATSVGLFVPEFYRDAEVLLPQLYGQDLLTLVAVPVLAGALYYAHQGHSAATSSGSAALLWKQRAWGYVFTGVLLVKGTTLGLAVLAMIVFILQESQTVPLPQIVLFGLLSLTGLALVTQFIRAIPHSPSKTQAHAGAETRTD